MLCTILISCGRNTDAENTEVKIETGFYIGTSGNTHEYEINPNAARHPYNLELFTNDETGVTYKGDENFTIRKGVDVSKWQGNVDWKKVKEAGYGSVYYIYS